MTLPPQSTSGRFACRCDHVAAILGNYASAAEIEAMRKTLGLDQPLPLRFVFWLGRVLQGDLGVSIFSDRPVTELFMQRVEPTIMITLAVMTLSIAVAVPAGVLAGWKAGKWFDRAVMLFATMGFSTPVFVMAYVLILVFSVNLRLLPTSGYVSMFDNPWAAASSLVLPTLTVSVIFIAIIARITRTSMIEVLESDYIRTAHAKGVPTASLLFKHALRNASIPIVTTIGSAFAILIGGLVVTESVYAIPGMGRLVVDAIVRRDYPIIQGVVLVFSAIYVLINLLIDITYSLLDPRIRA